jgi:hypothetical protein
VLEEVKPERDVNKRKVRKDNWWLFGETMPKTRESIASLSRYIATPETAKHRTFQFLDCSILPDNKLVVIAIEDAYFLGILSSKIHVTWSLAAGGRLGFGNDPVYVKTRCFDPFPFPEPTPDRKQKIRELGERLDAHRKRVQAQHPDVTITAMYNLLEKIRAGVELTDKDREFNNKALVSTLKQIHDELDAAVFEAYGWSDLLDPPQPSSTNWQPCAICSALKAANGQWSKLPLNSKAHLDKNKPFSPVSKAWKHWELLPSTKKKGAIAGIWQSCKRQARS